MEWQHFCHAFRSWSRQSLDPSCKHVAVSADEHAMRGLLMCAKPIEFQGRYYGVKCANRSCSTCKDNLTKLSCAICMEKRPRITWMKWKDVPYICADGREVSSYDFVEVTTPIADFMAAYDKHIRFFFQHHDRAKWQDDDWNVAWTNPGLFGGATAENINTGWCIAGVEDFSQSYTHRPKREHAGRFFHSISTTIYGCILRIPLAAFKDSYISAPLREKLTILFAEHDVSPVLTICTFGISPDQGHDTAFVQHYHEKHLYPWLEENCHKIDTYMMRSDGCTGQFKCGRHFRWLATHSTTNMKQIKVVHSHSESCHGKDMSDPECGRLKYLLEAREMQHTLEAPTQMDTSQVCWEFMVKTMQPQRTLFEKKGVGVHERVFFYIGLFPPSLPP